MVRASYGQPPLELEVTETGSGDVGLEWLLHRRLLCVCRWMSRVQLSCPTGAVLAAFVMSLQRMFYMARADTAVLDGAIVLVGTTAPATF